MRIAWTKRWVANIACRCCEQRFASVMLKTRIYAAAELDPAVDIHVKCVIDNTPIEPRRPCEQHSRRCHHWWRHQRMLHRLLSCQVGSKEHHSFWRRTTLLPAQ